jgi:hypothetical protein
MEALLLHHLAAMCIGKRQRPRAPRLVPGVIQRCNISYSVHACTSAIQCMRVLTCNNTRTHERTHARTGTRAHTRTRTCKHKCPCHLSRQPTRRRTCHRTELLPYPACRTHRRNAMVQAQQEPAAPLAPPQVHSIPARQEHPTRALALASASWRGEQQATWQEEPRSTRHPSS